MFTVFLVYVPILTKSTAHLKKKTEPNYTVSKFKMSQKKKKTPVIPCLEYALEYSRKKVHEDETRLTKY